MARPSLLTPELSSKILALTRTGTTWVRVAESLGIAESTLHGWRQRGTRERARIDEGLEPTKAETPFLEFVESLERAEAEGEVFLAALVRKAAEGGGKTIRTVTKSAVDGDGLLVITEQITTETIHPGNAQHAEWLLERRWPQRWRKRESLDVAFSADDLAAMLAEVVVEVVNDPSLKLPAKKRAAARAKAAELLQEFAAGTDG